MLTSNIIEKGSDFDETILVAKVSVEKNYISSRNRIEKLLKMSSLFIFGPAALLEGPMNSALSVRPAGRPSVNTINTKS